MKYAVLLHGNGVFDGTEIQEAICCLLTIAQAGHEYQCIAPDVNQHHVINHITGDEMNESRNVLVESARIARGDIKKVDDISVDDFDGLVMPGGFGTAKNITKWAFDGPNGPILEEVKNLILAFAAAKKPIAALCMSPTTVAKAFQGSEMQPTLSVGSTEQSSPYEIGAISQGIEKTGAKTEMKTVSEISVDQQNKIICAPCYMMDATIVEVYENTKQAVDVLIKMS